MEKTDFITQEQEWYGERKKVVISKDGKSYCSLLFFDKENVQEIWSIYVTEDERRKGRCKELLDYVDSINTRKYTFVYIEEDSPEWLEKFYDKRGYIVRKVSNKLY